MTAKIIRQYISQSLLVAVILVAAIFMFTQTTYAAEYDCGTYGAGDYSSNESCTPPAGNTGDDSHSAGGGLSNTGQALVVIIPAAMIAGGSVMLYRLNRKHKSIDTSEKAATKGGPYTGRG